MSQHGRHSPTIGKFWSLENTLGCWMALLLPKSKIQGLSALPVSNESAQSAQPYIWQCLLAGRHTWMFQGTCLPNTKT